MVRSLTRNHFCHRNIIGRADKQSASADFHDVKVDALRLSTLRMYFCLLLKEGKQLSRRHRTYANVGLRHLRTREIFCRVDKRSASTVPPFGGCAALIHPTFGTLLRKS